MPINRPRAVCTHEAAHAVVASFFGLRTLRIVIEGARSGYVQYDMGRWQQIQKFPLANACVLLAGSIAEHQFCERPAHDWAEEDYLAAQDAVGEGPRMNAAKQLTFSMVMGMKVPIEVVAGELGRRDLTGSEFRELIRKWA